MSQSIRERTFQSAPLPIRLRNDAQNALHVVKVRSDRRFCRAGTRRVAERGSAGSRRELEAQRDERRGEQPAYILDDLWPLDDVTAEP